MGAKITQQDLYLMAGINPKTGLPLRYEDQEAHRYNEIKKMLYIMDRQTAVNRYKWGMLPISLTSEELERLVYLKGQLALFYVEELEEFFILPFALSGTIDPYGRYNYIKPIPFTDGVDSQKDAKTPLSLLLSNKEFKVVKDVLLTPPTYDDRTKSAVILWDYSKEFAENILPRFLINKPLLEEMAEIIPYMKTCLLKGTGVEGVRVNSADEEADISQMSKSIKDSALKGKPYVAVTGALDFQELAGGSLSKAEEYLLCFQALDNLRLSTYGIENGGIFEKKAHILEAEAQMNMPSVSVIFADGLAQRQRFCDIVNSIWDLGMYVEPSESIVKTDLNGDGVAYDRHQAPEEAEGEEKDE